MQLRNVLLMLVLAILSLVAWLLIDGSGKTGTTALPTVYPTFDRSSVNRVEIALKSGEQATLRRRPGASDQWDILKKTDWVPADAPRVDDLLLAVAQQSVVNRITVSEDLDLSEFELDDAKVTAKFEMPGETLELRYGRQTPGGGSVYVDAGDGTDVYVVDAGGMHQIRDGLLRGLESLELFGGDVITFDVTSLEVYRDGAEEPSVVVRKKAPFWHVEKPYQGYAEPTPFERVIGALVVTQVERWVYGQVDMAKYGLDRPRARLVLTKSNGDVRVALLGAPVDGERPDGPSYVSIEGTTHVAIVGERWVQAALADPNGYRDRAFSRLGIDGIRMLVTYDGKHYELSKAMQTQWEITKPIRREPADGEYVEQVLEDVRAWKILAFHDAMDPDAAAIGEQGVLEIERQGGELLQYRLGKPIDETSLFAQRFVSGEADGKVVAVTRSVADRLREGHEQFLSKSVRKVVIEELESIRRHAPEENGIQPFKLAVTNPEGKGLRVWENDGPGQLGVVDQAAVSDLLSPLADLRTLRWYPYDGSEEQRKGFGFDSTVDGWGRWMTLEFSYNEVGQSNVGGGDQVLLIGNKAPGGGRFARFKSSPEDPKHRYAFVLADDVVERLMLKVFKDQ